MKVATMSLASRLRVAASLLMSLPTIVAVACFAHGHGAVGSNALLALLAACVAAGAAGSYLLSSVARKPNAPARIAATASPSTN